MRRRGRFHILPPLDFRFLDLMLILLIGGMIAVVMLLVSQRFLQQRQPFSILNSLLPSASTNQVYSQELFAEGGEPPYRWTAESLPNGITVDRRGLLHGLSTQAGEFEVTLFSTDAMGETASKRLTLQVRKAPATLPLRLLTRSLPAAITGMHYEVVLAVSGGTHPLHWNIHGLPHGLTVSANTLSGTPKKQDIGTVVVEVSDSNGQRQRAEYLLRVFQSQSATIDDALKPLHVTSVLPPAVYGASYWIQLSAAGGVPPYQWQLLQEIPGLSLSPNGRLGSDEIVLSSNKSVLYVRVFDAAGKTAIGELTLNMVRPPDILWKAVMIAGFVGAWLTLLLLLRHWTRARPKPIGIRTADLSTTLAIAFAGVGVAVYVGGEWSAAIFTIAMAFFGYKLYRDYT